MPHRLTMQAGPLVHLAIDGMLHQLSTVGCLPHTPSLPPSHSGSSYQPRRTCFPQIQHWVLLDVLAVPDTAGAICEVRREVQAILFRTLHLTRSGQRTTTSRQGFPDDCQGLRAEHEGHGRAGRVPRKNCALPPLGLMWAIF